MIEDKNGGMVKHKCSELLICLRNTWNREEKRENPKQKIERERERENTETG
jgi:hypothetical protein